MKLLFEDTPLFNRFISLIILALGAAGIGIQGSYLSIRSNYAAYSDSVTLLTGLSTNGLSLDICIAGAAIVLVAGFVSLLGSVALRRSEGSRKLFIACLIFAFCGGIIELIGGLVVVTSSFNANVTGNTYIFNEARATEHLSGDQLKMAHMGYIVWENCCFAKGWSSQNPFAGCEVTCPSPSSGALTEALIFEFTDLFNTNDLCTCVRSEVNASYVAMQAKMTQSVCTAFSNMLLRFDPTIVIPKTNNVLTLGTVRNRLFGSVKIAAVPFVGFQLPANQDITGQTQEGFGFGCGLGYPKGVMWIQDLFNIQQILPQGNAGLGLGIAAVVVVLIAFLIGYLFASEEDGEPTDTLAVDWNDPNKQHIPVAKTIDDSWGPTLGPAAKALEQQLPVLSSSNSNDLTEQLVTFYKKHDPLKSKKEIEGIAAYGKQNGLTALNKKLRDKYKVDLSGATNEDMDGPPI